jgi:Glycoside-hydrolase family GH114
MVRMLLAALALGLPLAAPAEGAKPPPANAGFDYQIGGDYALPAGVGVVSRDWYIGHAPRGVYAICYVNAFQTQDDESGVRRRDERSSWPSDLVLRQLGDDPNWGGEYLVNISTAEKRRRATRWVEQMINGCARKGFEAVEYDNLDSWTRFDGTPLANRVPFEKRQALAYAKMLAERAHAKGLAVGQKNTVDVTSEQSRRVDFDFAIAEECARYDECNGYRRVYANRMIEIEYRRKDLRRACRALGDEISIVLRDRQVSVPTAARYVYDAC